MTMKPDFSNINSPMKQKTDRPVPNTMTTDANRTSEVNQGPRHTNPRHEWASHLESLKYGKGDAVITRQGQPTRPVINHAQKVDRTCMHQNSGTKRTAHKFPGRRV
jgi:hypothetical protein